MAIKIAETDAEILACYPVIAQLRPHIEPQELVDRVRDQAKQGYRIAYIARAENVVTVAGYHVSNSLAWGKFLFVDDLVTAGLERSRGDGQKMVDWLLEQAHEAKCDSFHLDCGVQRHAAHRFYLRNRMSITSHHFSLNLTG